MAGIGKQIIGSFEDIGKDIAREVVSVPTDILGKAIESIGSSTPKKQQNTKQSGDTKPVETQSGALEDLNNAPDAQTKKAIARAALAQIAGTKPKQKEPSVWERNVQEKEQKDAANKQQNAAARASQLQPMSSARKRGDLYGIKAKRAGSEMSKNVRQD